MLSILRPRSLVVLAAIMLVGCSTSPNASLKGTQWQLEESTVNGHLLPAGGATLEFKRNEMVVFRIGQTELQGTYELSNSDQSVTCKFDRKLVGRTEHIQTITMKNDRLYLCDDDGTVVTFTRVR